MFPTATAAEAANEPDDIALKVGLGVGIPVAVIIIAVLAAAWRIRRARKQRAVSSEVHHKAE
jgi:heme/copper-type cytochrome/quinol oxidase subunit 2